jgi:predicted alpha/beta-hydrolase family hydrolase
MDSDFMTAMADLLTTRGLAVARFEFPYMARRRIDGVNARPTACRFCWPPSRRRRRKRGRDSPACRY